MAWYHKRDICLSAMKWVFSYLKKFAKEKIVIDSGCRDNSAFQLNEFNNWKEFHLDVAEELPDNMPTPFGKAVRIGCCVH